ncbi:angiotensinogen [Malurus melanocephalus]|uniref:angiotensinogen n=1 Tax=Malurus melanocephalus TaxID=175006 RepID=UPI002549644C|nr:angiotensinogen [Malurus melanocephalus]XP_057229621.1 angiotensinogen [Malurus melanocephalus]
MTLVADILCLLACLIVVTCDRVYVHPFNLFSFKKSDCDRLEKLVQEGKTIVPVSTEFQSIPEYEGDMTDSKLEVPSINAWGKEERGYLRDLVYVLGMRFYSALQKAERDQNVLLSPTSLYSSLVSFYLGASNQTALDLQGLLGFVPPSGNPDCTSTAIGKIFLSNLRTIERLVNTEHEDLLFSKTLSLFSAPGIPLFQLFVENLLPNVDAFYARAVDFTNPGEAAKQINAFVEAKSKGQSKGLLADIDPSAELLFAMDARLAVNVTQAFQLKEPQEFWVDSNTKVSVPMLSITGTFKYKTDANGTFSVVEVPISNTVLLVLLQPINGSDLEHMEPELTWQSSAWFQQLSSREIKLTLPALIIEDSSDLQELLADMELPALLGKGADFSKISNASLTVGKVINKAFFKLASNGTDQSEDPAAQKDDGAYLDVILNKPFLFAVFEKQSRAMLFLGRVINPLHEE